MMVRRRRRRSCDDDDDNDDVDMTSYDDVTRSSALLAYIKSLAVPCYCWLTR